MAAEHLAAQESDSFTLRFEEEGFLVFDARCAPKQVSNLPYLNNVFGVIDDFAGATQSMAEAMERLRGKHCRMEDARRLVTPHERTFRLFLLDSGQLVGDPGGAMTDVIDAISKATGLQFSSRKADGEFWLIRRRNGRCFFTKRLSRRAKTEKTLQKGELRPELAHLLCLLSEPCEDDIFLDPFAGSGAIPFARSHMPYNMIFISDNDEGRIQTIKADIKGSKAVRSRKGHPIIARTGDALALERIEDGFIHKVVTDPPWGLFDTDIADLPAFYRGLTRELIRITCTDGIIVLLIGDKAIADMLIDTTAEDLSLEARFEVLVNGQKASVLKWRRLAG